MLSYFSIIKDKMNFIASYDRLVQNRNDKIKISKNKSDFDPRIWLYVGDLAHIAGLDRLATGSLFECIIGCEVE